MPYRLSCKPKNRCRVYKKGTRTYFSKRKMPRARALLQMRALYAAEKR